MKWLVVDRGFLDGKQMCNLKKDWGVDTISELKSNMAIHVPEIFNRGLEDARGLLRLGKVEWQDYLPSRLETPLSRPKPEEILKREETRQQTLKEQGRWPEPQQSEKIVVFNDLTSWDACPLPLTVVLYFKKRINHPGDW